MWIHALEWFCFVSWHCFALCNSQIPVRLVVRHKSNVMVVPLTNVHMSEGKFLAERHKIDPGLIAIKHCSQPCWKAIMKIFYAVLGVTVAWLQQILLLGYFVVRSKLCTVHVSHDKSDHQQGRKGRCSLKECGWQFCSVHFGSSQEDMVNLSILLLVVFNCRCIDAFSRISKPDKFGGYIQSRMSLPSNAWCNFQVAASSLEEEVAMLRAEVLADGSVGHNSACGLLLEVRQCWGMFVVRSRSLLLMDFLQCGCRIAQKLNWQLGSKSSGPPFWLSYNASTYHSAGEGATQDDRGVGESRGRRRKDHIT